MREPSDKQLRHARGFLFARSGSNPTASRAAGTDLPIVLQITSSHINDSAPAPTRPISIFIAHAGSVNSGTRDSAKPNRPRDIIDAKRRELRQRDTMMSQGRSLSGYRPRTSGGRIQIGIRGEIIRELFASCAARLGR